MDRPKRRTLPVIVASIAFGVTACGGSSSSPASASASGLNSPSPSETGVQAHSEPADQPPAGAIIIAAGPGPKFTPNHVEITAADPLTFFIDMTPATHTHNFNIGPELPPAPALATAVTMFNPGQSVVVTVTGLAPGTYQFWCSVDEHYKYGMHGTLTVK